nr:uncharacterized protein LOC101883236 isoform X2 [Danio rerio]XP_021324773.1 uncharacterized protein LOC101883236 isoform X2 [Danio rerio]XP_021324774.1 uncharacterized protein LOC101883236 isoform X2 [Danio rerio]XP_021324775.1 uncharacterized protein LOC101883236 isoform X2 [Danio rerio]XP_021324776.1 uncharacterized protein LOC101883236 isoform X2 [Danio rerio]XP_021324777.1 uncharacterized protein LOC101883236 isoform X2 [Danio rerio]|eukprot:XP_017208373.1 uncharacterized protein LOC101883236 isoform X2 [Danio rerio]
MVYGFSHKVQRNGQLNLMGAVCFPLDASPSNTGLTSPPTANQYPSIIIPTDKVHNKLGVSPSPGAVLVLHSLLLEFPLAMAFAEQLLTYSLGETIERSEDELDTVPTSVLIQVVELLGRDQQPDPVVPTSRFIELKTLLVSNLHPMVTEQQLIEKFGALGSISTVQVCRNNIISPAYAFVTFHHRRDAVRAQKALNFTDLLNKPLIIMWGPDKTIEVLSDNDSSSPRQTEERETAGETEERKTSGETEREAAGDTEERKTSGETEREAAGDTEERKTSGETEREAAGETKERANSESSWGRRISNNVKSAMKAALSSPAAWVGVGIGVCAAYAYFRSRS